jgi:hypothetical protein
MSSQTPNTPVYGAYALDAQARLDIVAAALRAAVIAIVVRPPDTATRVRPRGQSLLLPAEG